MMAKENKMLLSTTWWQYRYLLACVIPIDQYGVPLFVLPFSLCTLYKGFSPFVLLQKREKESSYQLGFGFTPTTRYEKPGKNLFYKSFPAGARKPQIVETKRKKKIKDAFTNLRLCAAS
jgi:hypothetical protein